MKSRMTAAWRWMRPWLAVMAAVTLGMTSTSSWADGTVAPQGTDSKDVIFRILPDPLSGYPIWSGRTPDEACSEWLRFMSRVPGWRNSPPYTPVTQGWGFCGATSPSTGGYIDSTEIQVPVCPAKSELQYYTPPGSTTPPLPRCVCGAGTGPYASGGSYDYDASRRRIRKVTSSGEVIIFVYDLEGQLLGEYDPTGQAIREYVWLGNIPVAMFMPDPANASGPPLVFYVHADHLNAPRVVVDQNGAKRWRWIAEPFGTTAPEINPEGLGAFTQNLRFPGQYADAESGLWYNYFRFYASDVGAYRQSDPIGLAGGSLSTYAYVDANPLMFFDLTGLERIVLQSPAYGSLDLFDRIPEEPGVIDVVAHGNWHEVTENQKIINERQLAEMIRKRFPDYKKMKVRLLSCNTGSDSYRGVKVVPFAKNLHRILGVPVVAPNRSIWAASDGTFSVYGHKGDIHGPKNRADQGQMVEFND